MGALQKQGLTLAHNDHAFDETVANLEGQREHARARGAFTRAEELDSTLSGVKNAVMQAKEGIVNGKYMMEREMLTARFEDEKDKLSGTLSSAQERVSHGNVMQIAELERIHHAERVQLEQLLHDKVRHEFTPTPSMLDLQKQIQYLLQSREYDRAEVVRRDLVNQEHKERKQWAEELWRSWGCRRNRLAYQQRVERARVESDISSTRAKLAVQSAEEAERLAKRYEFTQRVLDEKFMPINAAAKQRVRNTALRLPAVVNEGKTIPFASEGEEQVSHTSAPGGKILHRGWVFQKGGRKANGEVSDAVEHGRRSRSGGAPVSLGADGTRFKGSRRSQSAGGAVSATVWRRHFAVLSSENGLHLYTSEEDFSSDPTSAVAVVAGGAHIALRDTELRVVRQPLSERNYQPGGRLTLELVNSLYTTRAHGMDTAAPELCSEIKVVTLLVEQRRDFDFWCHHLAKCTRAYGRADPTVKAALGFGRRRGQSSTGMLGRTSMGSPQPTVMCHKSQTDLIFDDASEAQGFGASTGFGNSLRCQSAVSLGGTREASFKPSSTLVQIMDGRSSEVKWTDRAFKKRWH